jgi:hypothetical protein
MSKSKTSLAKKACRARSQNRVSAHKATRHARHIKKHPTDKQTVDQAKKANQKGLNGFRKEKVVGFLDLHPSGKEKKK